MNSSPSADHVGCSGGVLRRFLCSGRLLRARALDNCGADGEPQSGRLEEVANLGAVSPPPPPPPPPPCLVARLMGLDAMPRDDRKEDEAEAAIVFGRSRSMSSIQSGGDAQRLRKSSSFREIPTFLRPENEDFWLLSFTRPAEEEEEEEKSPVKIDTYLLELQEEATSDGRRPKIACRSNEKTWKKKKKKKKSGTKTDSPETSSSSSPVSVLCQVSDDHYYYYIDTSPTATDQQNSTPARDNHNTQDPNQQQSPRSSQLEGSSSSSRKLQLLTTDSRATRSAASSRGSPELWRVIRRLTDEDVNRNHPIWVLGITTFADEDVVGIEEEIFDLLLWELLLEIVL